MMKPKMRDFDSVDALISWLDKKYNGPQQAWTSSSRFNVTVVFFHGKAAYHNFLQLASFPKCLLSEKVPADTTTFNCSDAQKWIEEALWESEGHPQILLPITEYIRFCSQFNARIVDNVFNDLLLAENEGARFIVPMLDFHTKYKEFFEEFVHQNRMADVCSVNVTSPYDEQVIELILDPSGYLPKNDIKLISNTREWIRLWETGEIADKSKILVQNPKIIRALTSMDINIPKVDRITLSNNRSRLSFWYHIDSSAFIIEPSDEIWNYIFSVCKGKQGPITWSDIVQFTLGPNIALDEMCFDLWESSTSEKKSIKRWFWLNEAKKEGLKSPFLTYCTNFTNDPEELLDIAWSKPLTDPGDLSITFEFLKERRVFFGKFANPYFKYGQEEKEKEFYNFINMQGISRNHDYITGIFGFEKLSLVSIAISDLKEIESEVALKNIAEYKEIWPTLGIYLENSFVNKPDVIPDNLDYFEFFIEAYLAEYTYSKVIHDAESVQLIQLRKKFASNFVSVLAKVNTRDIPSLTEPSLIEDLRRLGFIFIDGVGYEWFNVVRYLFEKHGWTVLDSKPVLANLPTDTPHSGINTGYIEKINAFDKLLHSPYRYPDTLFEELKTLEMIISDIHERYKSRKEPLFIVSDHGATVFARKGRGIPLDGNDPQSSGRYAYCNNVRVSEKEFVYTVQDADGKIVISLNYDNFDKNAPKGEAHGGGTLEEMCTFYMLVAPAMQQSIERDEVEVNFDKPEYSPFDDEINLSMRLATTIHVDTLHLKVNRGPMKLVPVSNPISRKVTLQRVELLKQGLDVGDNLIEVIINGKISGSATLKYQSGSEKTDFENEFDI